MKKTFYYFFLLFSMFYFLSGNANAQTPTLVWSDEFDQAAFNGSTFGGTNPDPNQGFDWHIQEGNGQEYGIAGWGNQELQIYREENVYLDNGELVILIEAVDKPAPGWDYYSARIRTHKLQEFQYGRFEAMIKLPSRGGLWPAFWTLGADQDEVGWPTCGEIDIMEYMTNSSDATSSALHYNDVNGDHRFRYDHFPSIDGYEFWNNYHLFVLEWDANEVRYYVDDILFFKVNKNEDFEADEVWRFDKPHHLLLNVAVGGNLGGTVEEGTWTDEMRVQYVRVYDGPKPTIRGNRLVEANAIGEVYTVDNSGGVNISWTVPAGATIVSGQGTNAVTVDFGNTSGDVTATFDVGNGNETLPIDVHVMPTYASDFVFESFENGLSTGQATFSESDGTLTVIPNHDPNAINSSTQVGEYYRLGTDLYDCIIYTTNAITNADEYASNLATKKVYMDVWTNEAPIGSQIYFQIENGAETTEFNYPTGRHSRYVGTIEKQGEWHRIPFEFLDKPDPDCDPTACNELVILFNSHSETDYLYYWDNWESYLAQVGVSHTITATAGTNGTITPSGDVTVAEGADQAFTITADAGYLIDDVLVDGVSVGAVGTYTFTNVTQNHTISASFIPATYTLTVNIDPAASGSVALNPDLAEYDHGTTVDITPTPAAGYEFSHFSGDIDTYWTITATADLNGSIDPTGDVMVIEAGSQTFNINPSAGYQVADVLVDAVSVGAVTSYTFNNVIQHHTIHATFEESTGDPCVEELPFSEAFGTDVFAAGVPCWETAPTAGAINWVVDAGSAYFNGAGGNEAARMTTPPLNLTGYSEATLVFDEQRISDGGGPNLRIDELHVEYWDGAAWQIIVSYTAEQLNFATRTVQLPAASFNGEYLIGFRAVSDTRAATSTRVDNVSVTGVVKSSDKNSKVNTATVIMDKDRIITAHFIEESVLLGDVNDDTFINVLDVVWMVRYISGDIPVGFIEAAGDLNGDTFIDVADLTALIDLIHAGAKDGNDSVSSEEAYMSINDKGMVSLISDGTLLAMQFEVTSDHASEMQADLLLNTDHKLSFNNETGKGVIYSMYNNNIPEGEIELFAVSGVDIDGFAWGDALASNANYDVVDVVTNTTDNDQDATDITDLVSDDINISVFPNPNTGNFKVKAVLPNPAYIELIILDEVGRTVSKTERNNFSSGEHNINYTLGQSLNGGIYFLRVQVYDSKGRSMGVIHEEKIIIIK